MTIKDGVLDDGEVINTLCKCTDEEKHYDLQLK